MRFRIGIIDYLNTQPFQYELEDRLRPLGVEFVRGVPTELNRALLAGDIDLAPISAIFAAQHADRFVILPDHSISSLGAVKTVLLFSWRPDIRELDNTSIAITDHSATSVALLDVLCGKRYGIAPHFERMPQDLARMMRHCSGALVIGDAALVEGYWHRELLGPEGHPGRPTIFDLGDEWLKLTGLPFTFAIWAARCEVVASMLSLGIPQVLQDSKTAALNDLNGIAEAYAPRLGVPPGVCRRYLRDLRFDLTESDLSGLAAFTEMVLPDFTLESFSFLATELSPL